MRNYETSEKAMCNSSDQEEFRRGPWTLEEDNLLIHYINCHGEGCWNWAAKCAGLKRTGKSCRLRWLNYLKPDINRGNLTPYEQLLIIELHSKWGNRWSKIAKYLPGRTDNKIKNYWRTRVQKQARQLKVDANSKRFLEVVRCLWMPTLLNKMEQSSSFSSSTSSSPSMENQDSTTFAPLATNHVHTISKSSSPKGRKWMETSNSHMNKLNSTSSSNEMVFNFLPGEDDCYYFDVREPAMSNTGSQGLFQQSVVTDDSSTRSQVICNSEHLMVETGWLSDDVAEYIWSTNELWQELEET